jgi:hypothetical protein
MLSPTAIALLKASVIGGLAATIGLWWSSVPSVSVGVAFANLAIWTAIALAFGLSVLVPVAARFVASLYVRALLFFVGSVVWYLLFVLVWFFLLQSVPLAESFALSLPSLVPGAAVSGAFAMLWPGVQHA